MEVVVLGVLTTIHLVLKLNTLVWVSFLVELKIYPHVNVKIVAVVLLCVFPARHALFMLVGILMAYVYGRFSYYNGAEYDGRWRNNTLRSLRVWRLFHMYFGFEISMPFRFRPTRRGAIYAAYPHGFCPVSVMLATMFPGGTHSIDSVLGVSSNLFATPIVRELCLIFGCVSVDKRTLTHLLGTQNANVVLLPGGAKEMCGLDGKTHLGFLKLGWDLKIDVYPIFLCGEDRVFHVFDIFPKLRKLTTSWIGYPLPSPFIGPLPVKLKACVCRPVHPTNHRNFESFTKMFFRRLSRTTKQNDNARYFFPETPHYHDFKEPTVTEMWIHARNKMFPRTL